MLFNTLFYCLKILLLSYLLVFVSKDCLDFIPEFLKITHDELLVEIKTLEHFTGTQFLYKTEYLKNFVINQNTAVNLNPTAIFTYFFKDANFLALIKFRSLGLFLHIYPELIIFTLLVTVSFSIKKRINVSRHQSPHFVKVLCSYCLLILNTLYIFLTIQLMFNPIIILCFMQMLILAVIAIRLVYGLGFGSL